jgi:hypothetical protein
MAMMLDNRSRQFVEDRAWPRLNYEINTEMIVYGERQPCKIVDQCEAGFGIISSLKLHKGDMVEFVDPSANAEVIWAQNCRAGLKVFD